MWWQPPHTQLESCSGSRLRQVVTQDVLCTHTHTHLLPLLWAATCRKKKKKRGARRWVFTDIDSSGDNSSIAPCVWVFRRVCLRASVNSRECVCVWCVAQDCQHISSQWEPYRNRDICGVKGRQLAWPSLEERRKEERKGEPAGAPNQLIIRGETWVLQIEIVLFNLIKRTLLSPKT